MEGSGFLPSLIHPIKRGCMSLHPPSRIALFQCKETRRALRGNEWWFVLTDVIAALADSVNPSDYLKKLRKRDPSLQKPSKGGATCPPL